MYNKKNRELIQFITNFVVYFLIIFTSSDAILQNLYGFSRFSSKKFFQINKILTTLNDLIT